MNEIEDEKFEKEKRQIKLSFHNEHIEAHKSSSPMYLPKWQQNRFYTDTSIYPHDLRKKLLLFRTIERQTL